MKIRERMVANWANCYIMDTMVSAYAGFTINNPGNSQNYNAHGGNSDMEITDIRIRKVEAEGKMKAVVSVTFDNEFVVHDIKIIESQGGLFIAMPSRKTPTGEFRDIAHPINADSRNKVQSAILVKYQTMLAEEEALAVVPEA